MNRITLCAALAAASLALPANAQDQAQDRTDDAAWHNQQQAALFAPIGVEGWYLLDGGVWFRRTGGDGTGPAPTVRDVVSVNYTGSFADGSTFDSNEGRDPVTFPLGRLVPGWQIAIPYMGVGDTAEIIVPAELGYGPRGAGPIPGGATLLFTIELLDIMAAPGR